MPPDLVVANSAFTVYPGGVIALRCTDWMGPARGTLTSEVDARAITGEAVRDTQTTASSLFSAAATAFANADDTLVIDLSLLPVEPSLRYAMFMSVLIEGDWDTTNSDTYRASSQSHFVFTCELGYYGDSDHPTEADFSTVFTKFRKIDHYTISQLGGTFALEEVVGDEIIHIRAYSRAGTTCEWLLDQIFLVPDAGPTSDGWSVWDFQRVGGGANDFGFIPMDDGSFIDGADGGDSNGKFTWQPFQVPSDQQTNYTGADGGGDFQKKASYSSAEYMLRVVDDDFYELYNFTPPDPPASAHAYSFAGQLYRFQQNVLTDDFSRTIAAGSGWGSTPEGFAWSATLGLSNGWTEVNGSVGIHHMGGVVGAAVLKASALGTSSAGAMLEMSDFILSGEVLVTAPAAWFDGTTTAALRIICNDAAADFMDFQIHIDPINEEWELRAFHTPILFTVLHGPVDISSWYAEGSFVGWKIEIKRYLIRVKVWDATGAEPGAWDFSGFKPLDDGALNVAYDYSSDLYLTPEERGNISILLQTAHDDAIAQWESHWDNVVIDYDPYGNRDNISIATERPEGTLVGEIVVPDGAQQMISWGSMDWTDLNFGSSVLAFSSRIWSAVGAAELQQARLLWYWFRSIHGGIVSMNWRSSERPGDVWRVLVGDR